MIIDLFHSERSPQGSLSFLEVIFSSYCRPLDEMQLCVRSPAFADCGSGGDQIEVPSQPDYPTQWTAYLGKAAAALMKRD